MDEYLTLLRALSDGAVLQEMVHELYADLSTVGSKFGRISHCRRWAVTSFLPWIALILMTITL
jgi:hypothetical protein